MVESIACHLLELRVYPVAEDSAWESLQPDLFFGKITLVAVMMSYSGQIWRLA